MSPFIYDALAHSEIRLLSPIDPSDGSKWSLQTVSLDNPDLEFDALSYTWGSQAQTFLITCNEQQLHVHHNLYHALPFLARRKKGAAPRPIWIDAVCINQADDNEKAVQIRLMHRIYRQAEEVWAWLGGKTTHRGLRCAEDQDRIEQAITLLRLIAEEHRRRKNHRPPLQEAEDVAPGLQGLETAVWRAILHLLRNPWYTRVWIVQEAALARNLTFLCGDHTIDAQVLYKAVKHDLISHLWTIRYANNASMDIPLPPVKCAAVFNIRRIHQGSHWMGYFKPADRLVLASLDMVGIHNCFLPQDRVLGILGLVSEMDLKDGGFDVDKFTSVPYLYTQFSRFVLLNTNPSEHHRWWEYLSRAFTFKRMVGLPSWVPDLHHQSMDDGDVPVPYRSIKQFENVRSYYRSSRRPCAVKGGLSIDEIVIQGKVFDEVIRVHREIPLQPDSESGDLIASLRWLIVIAEWEKEVAGAVLRDGSVDVHQDVGVTVGEHQFISKDTYWHTLLADVSGDTNDTSTATGETLHQFRDLVEQIRHFMEKNIDRTDPNSAAELFKDDLSELVQAVSGTPIDNFLDRLTNLSDRQLFNTRQGRFGFTTRGVQPRDIVCVFNSASTPHVLRSVDDRAGGLEIYRFVGDAYVHGMMHEEADELDLEEKDIVLV